MPNFTWQEVSIEVDEDGFMEEPDQWNDDYRNTRFTTEGVHKLERIEMMFYGPASNCTGDGITVFVWSSRNGFPDRVIDSVDIACEDILFSSEDTWEWTSIDVSDRDIYVGGDFHIGYTVKDWDTDTVSILSDNGENHSAWDSLRSSEWWWGHWWSIALGWGIDCSFMINAVLCPVRDTPGCSRPGSRLWRRRRRQPDSAQGRHHLREDHRGDLHRHPPRWRCFRRRAQRTAAAPG